MYSLPTPLMKRTSGQPSSYILGQGYPLYLVIYNNERMKITPNQMLEIFSKQSYQYIQRKLHLRKWNYRAQFIFQNKNTRNQAIQLIKKIKEKYDVNCYYYFQRGHSTYSLMEQWEYRNAINLANTNPIIVNQIIPNSSGNKRQTNQNAIQIQTYPRANNDEKRAKNIELQENLILEEVQFKKQNSNLSIKRQTNQKKEIESGSDKQQIEVQLEREQQKIILEGSSQKRSKHKKDRQISIQIQRESDRYMLEKQKVRDKISNKQKYSSKEQKNKINIDNYKINRANVTSEIQIFKQEQNKYRQKQKAKLRKQQDTPIFTPNQSNLMNIQNSNLKEKILDHKTPDKKPQIDTNFEKKSPDRDVKIHVQMQEQQGQKVLNESQKKIHIIELQIDNQQQPIAVPLNQSKQDKIDQYNLMKQNDNEDNQFLIPNQQIMQILNNQQLVSQILMLEVQIFNFCQ